LRKPLDLSLPGGRLAAGGGVSYNRPMRRIYLRDCQAGDVVEDVFVLSGKQLAMGANNKQYVKGFLSDRSAQLVMRLWNATRDVFHNLPDGGFVRVRARIENYQSNLQAVVEQTWPAKDGTFDIGDLLPHTEKDVGQMCRKLAEMLGSIQNRHLAALVQAYLDDEKLMADFCRAPAAMSFHHAYIGGLLEHTLNAVEVADVVSRFYPGLNRDVVVAGIFLHDIAKTWELCYDCAFGYTDGGQLVGHIVKSAMWIEHKARDAERMLGEPIPQPLIDVMQHIVLSHHGTVAEGFGSARSPSTPEAIFVHEIENLDAKMMMSLGATRSTNVAGNEGNWTEYVKAFSGRLYRPDVAPAEAAVEEAVEEAPDLPPSTSHASAAPNGKPAFELANAPAEAAPAPAGTLSITNPLFASIEPRRR
jgi:3'-5' exoribonuclease